MRIIKYEIIGDDLYKNQTFGMDLYASDNVVKRDGLQNAGETFRLGKSNIHTNNVVGMFGVNASGKTTSINLLQLALTLIGSPYIVYSDRFIAHEPPAKLGGSFTARVIFWYEDQFYLLESQGTQTGDNDSGSAWLNLGDETLWRLRKRPAKRLMGDFDLFKESSEVIMRRNGVSGERGALTSDQRTFLRPDMSIAYSLTSKAHASSRVGGRVLMHSSYPAPVIQAFDSSVERLDWDATSNTYVLKFAGEEDQRLSEDAARKRLSRGTRIGAGLVRDATRVLRGGGYMLIDEIETGLNRSLVRTIIELFTSTSTNPFGAQLIFTTHYPEILDFLRRKDNVYLLLRDDSHLAEASKYSDHMNRVENKKSQVILSNVIEGSMPNYPEIESLRKYVREHVNG